MNRMMICAIVVLAEVASASQLRPETQVSSQLPVDSELHRILSERIKGFENRVSITVGVIGPQGERIVSKGAVGSDDSQPASDALFTFDFEPSSPRRASQLTFSWGFFDPRRATRID